MHLMITHSMNIFFSKNLFYFNELARFGQFIKYTLFRSPFLLPKVPIWSPFHSKWGPHLVPILKNLGECLSCEYFSRWIFFRGKHFSIQISNLHRLLWSCFTQWWAILFHVGFARWGNTFAFWGNIINIWGNILRSLHTSHPSYFTVRRTVPFHGEIATDFSSIHLNLHWREDTL